MKSKTFRFFVCGLALASLPLAGCGKTSSSGSASVSGSNTGTSDSASASTSSGSSEEPAPTAGTTAYGAYEVSYNAKKDGVIVSKDTLLSRANLTGSETLSKTRFFDLLYYAYHDAMPNHQGQRLYTAAPAIPASFYGHVPTNAVLAYEWLNGRGLYTPEKDSSGADITSFNGSKAVTDAFMKTYFKRIHSYYGISQLDDFATSVDYDYYFEDTSRVAGTSNSLTYDTQIVSNANIAQWFQIHLLTMATGTHRDNIFNFYNSYNDDSVKVKGNLGGFYTKFKEIADASSVSSFLTLDESLFATQGFDPLFKTFEGDSVHDDVKTVLCCIDPYTSTYSSTDYAAGTEKYATDLATKEYIFENLGFENAEATALATGYADLTAKLIVDHETAIAAGKKDEKALLKKGVTYGSSLEMGKHFENAGYTFTNQSSFLTDGGYLPIEWKSNSLWGEAMLNNLSDTYLAGYKAYVIMSEVNAFGYAMPSEVVATLFGAASTSAYAANPDNYVPKFIMAVENDFMAEYVKTDEYTKNYQLILASLEKIKSALSARIKSSKWLSDDGKAKMQKKIDKMKGTAMVNSSDGTQWNLTNPTYSSTNTLSENAFLSSKILYGRWMSALGQRPVDEVFFSSFQKFTPNAFYDPAHNQMVIMAGYLASHGGFTDMKINQLGAELYWAIGHEVSHGFDSNGVNYDENGTYNEAWLSAADHEAFTAKTAGITASYDDYELMPGESRKAAITMPEDIADVSGMRLALDLTMADPSGDYKTFFTACAHAYRSTAARLFYVYALAPDVHSFGNARINPCFRLFDEFINAYGVTERDSMWLDPSYRGGVWSD
jgi:predicted metalloendopeptidase